MAGVGYKAAPGRFRGLQAAREAVELRGQLGDLVVSPNHGPVAVSSLPDLADGLEQVPDLPGEGTGQQGAEGYHQDADEQGDTRQVRLKALEQLRLLCVVFIGVYRADDAVAVYHRGRPPAQKGMAVVPAVKGIVAVQGLDDLRIRGIHAPGIAALPAVKQDAPGSVRYQQAGHAGLLHRGQSLPHIFLRQLRQTGQGRLHHLDAALHGGLLGLEHQTLGDQQRIGVQKGQHRQDDEDIAHAELKL